VWVQAWGRDSCPILSYHSPAVGDVIGGLKRSNGGKGARAPGSSEVEITWHPPRLRCRALDESEMVLVSSETQGLGLGRGRIGRSIWVSDETGDDC
jgi:hypothetical protein